MEPHTVLYSGILCRSAQPEEAHNSVSLIHMKENSAIKSNRYRNGTLTPSTMYSIFSVLMVEHVPRREFNVKLKKTCGSCPARDDMISKPNEKNVSNPAIP